MSTMNPDQLQKIIEAALMVAGKPLSVSNLQKLFEAPEGEEQLSNAEIKAALKAIAERYTESGIELREVASGYQFQARTEFSPWLTKLWEERPQRYSRALLETLSLIIYRQPITRAEIEEIRGVTVSSHIVRVLVERDWVKIIGYKDVPGKPALYGTTKAFLDHFNLKGLDELPSLAEIKDLESQEAKLHVQLEFDNQEEENEFSEEKEELTNPNE